jgi:ferredoxin-type protein NapH
MPLIDSGLVTILLYIAIVVVGIFCILKFTKNKTRKVSNLRLFVQVVALVGIFMGLLIGPFGQQQWLPLGNSPRDNLIGRGLLGNQFPDGLSVPILACYYPSGRTVTCPIWQIQAYIYPFWDSGVRGYAVFYSTTGLEKIAIVFGLIIAMAFVLGRSFCGWLCPFGLYMDVITRIRKAFGKRHLSFTDKSNAKLRQFSYIVIAVLIILSFIFGSQAITGTQIVPGTDVGGGQGTEAGITSLVNEPFCLVCPVRPLCILAEVGIGTMKGSYVFHIVNADSWYILGFYVTSLNLTILIIVTILAIAYRRIWCRICPLGALTALFSSFTPFKQVALTKLQKDEKKCTKCGVCKRVCPTQATQMFERKDGDVTESRCMLCARCVEMCPYEGALTMKFAGKTLMKSRNWLESSTN